LVDAQQKLRGACRCGAIESAELMMRGNIAGLRECISALSAGKCPSAAPINLPRETYWLDKQSVCLLPVSPDRPHFFVIVVSVVSQINSQKQYIRRPTAQFVVGMDMDEFEQDQPFTF
jgi:hypothetical protein